MRCALVNDPFEYMYLGDWIVTMPASGFAEASFAYTENIALKKDKFEGSI